MEKYQKRVINELKKLEKKARKLQDFISNDDYPFVSDSLDDQLLISQLHAMWVYASILKRRIQNFEEVSEPTTTDDLFNNIGVVEVEDGDMKKALDEVFSIINEKIKEDNNGKSTQED